MLTPSLDLPPSSCVTLQSSLDASHSIQKPSVSSLGVSNSRQNTASLISRSGSIQSGTCATGGVQEHRDPLHFVLACGRKKSDRAFPRRCPHCCPAAPLLLLLPRQGGSGGGNVPATAKEPVADPDRKHLTRGCRLCRAHTHLLQVLQPGNFFSQLCNPANQVSAGLHVPFSRCPLRHHLLTVTVTGQSRCG